MDGQITLALPIEVFPTATDRGLRIVDNNGVEHYFYYKDQVRQIGKMEYDGNVMPVK